MGSQRSWQGLDLRCYRRSRCLLIFVLLALPLSATTYYVDNCVTVGSDSNNGTSTSTPWLTINKVNTSSLSAGDSILFQKTCTWNAQLAPPSSGSAGNLITFSSYGTGAKPIIDGTGVSTGGNGLVYLQKDYVVINGFEIRNGVDDGILNYSGVGDVISNNVVHDVQDYGISLYAASAQIITGNEIYNAALDTSTSWAGIRINGGSAKSGFTITNNKIHDCAGGSNGFVNGANGIYLGNVGLSNVVISDNEIYHNGNFSQTQAGRGITANLPTGDVTITGNYIHDMAASGFFVGESGNNFNLTITYNVFESNTLRQFGWETNGTVLVYGNTLYDDLTPGSLVGGTGIQYTGSSGTPTIKNNIFATGMNSNAAFIIVDASANLPTASNNIYWDLVNGAGASNWLINGKRYTFAQWVTATSEANSQEANPKLNGDLTLQSSSPAIDAGANLTSTYQMGLDPRTSFPWGTLNQNSQGSGWEIGAFVFVQQVPRAPPTSLSVRVK